MDTLQIYFAWDDDLYTVLKEKGFGQSGFQRKTLPIIYSDNCESTSGVTERRRKYVIDPRYFDRTYEELGWKKTERDTEPIIPAEKPRATFSLFDDNLLRIRIIPRVEEREQYHLEYSTMAAFGRLYSNWAIPVFTLKDSLQLLSCLEDRNSRSPPELMDIQIKLESKQAQRELMHYAEVPLISYKFSIGEFVHARNFLSMNGVTISLPALVFRAQKEFLDRMAPTLKLGFVRTRTQQGFEERKPQIAMKLSQPKITICLRGKRAKAKGIILTEEPNENFFVVPCDVFEQSLRSVLQYGANQPPLDL